MVVRKKKRGLSTLRNAVVLGVWGAVVSGVVAFTGSCTMLYMDFSRCFIEMITTVISFVILFRIENGKMSKYRQQKMQEGIRVATGIVMMVTSILLAVASIISFTPEIKEGDNWPAFISTIICVGVNLRLLLNYRKSLKEKFSHIIRAQYTMYRMKIAMNMFVVTVLAIAIFAPQWSFVAYIDLIGTILMAGFMFLEGIRNLRAISFKLEQIERDILVQ